MVGDRDRHEVHARAADEARHVHVHRVVVDFPRWRNLLQDAILHDRDPVAHGHRLDLVVRDIDEGGAQALMQLLQLDPGLHPQHRVQVGEGLVEQEHPRLADDGAAEGDALALAARELAGFPFEQGVELEDSARLFDARLDLGPWGASHL